MNQRFLKSAVAKNRLVFSALVSMWFISTKKVLGAYECATGDAKNDVCPPDLSSLQGIILRIVTIAITLIGLLVLFLIVKAGIQIMTAGGDAEKRAKGIKQLQITILGLVGIFAAYGLIVLLAKWLGVVEGPLSFVRGGQIIFDFMLP